MGKSSAKASIGACMAVTGKVEPMTEKLSAAHNEQILIDMRREGINPKANVPNPCPLITARKASRRILSIPP
jgi:hypothetical protein